MSSGDFPYHTLIAGTGITMSSNASWQRLDLDLSNNHEYKQLLKRVNELEKKLCILHENSELHGKFESLRHAYEEYKIIEKLVYEPRGMNEASK